MPDVQSTQAGAAVFSGGRGIRVNSPPVPALGPGFAMADRDASLAPKVVVVR